METRNTNAIRKFFARLLVIIGQLLVVLVLVLVVSMLTACEIVEPEPEPEPQPVYRPPAISCMTSVENYVDHYEGLAVLNVRYQNDCEETVRVRVSATLYVLPGRFVRDRERFETTISASRERWLCGNGETFAACAFREAVGNSAFEVSWNTEYCYLDQECDYPAYP